MQSDMVIMVVGSLVLVITILLFLCSLRRISGSTGLVTKLKILQVAFEYERISISDLSYKVDRPVEDVYIAIMWGIEKGMPMKIDGDDFVRLRDMKQPQDATEQLGESFVCPYCGHKNQQNLTECQNCGMSI